jgi:putative hydrolase of the HAD superfamily
MGRLMSMRTERGSSSASTIAVVVVAAATIVTVATATFVWPRVVVAASSLSKSKRQQRSCHHDDRPPTAAKSADSSTCCTRDAEEQICLVTEDNQEIAGGGRRGVMRRDNLWHRATYCLVLLSTSNDGEEQQQQQPPQHHDVVVLVQKRSHLKDYCPGKFDPLPGGVVGYGESYRTNAVRELAEEMGIRIMNDDDDEDYHQQSHHQLQRLFTFPYQDDRVKVWGEFYECRYTGGLDDIVLQPEEVAAVLPMSLHQLRARMDAAPDEFMPDARYAMQLYLQRRADHVVKRRLLHGYSSGNLDRYALRPKPQVVFFDCDDCLYFDGWQVANRLTHLIDEWCVQQRGLPPGRAYQLYHQYGTALRGLRAEGYVDDTAEAIDAFLQAVHDIPVHEMLPRDDALRDLILAMDPTIPRYVFTASVREHAERCLRALGIADLFVDIIDCRRCDLETKHSPHSFRVAMDVAGWTIPSAASSSTTASRISTRHGRSVGAASSSARSVAIVARTSRPTTPSWRLSASTICGMFYPSCFCRRRLSPRRRPLCPYNDDDY